MVLHSIKEGENQTFFSNAYNILILYEMNNFKV